MTGLEHPLLILWGGGLLAFVVIMYVILDGFDLGIGILFPWFKDQQHRDTMMNSIAPVWDGNETWMVLGAAMLYGIFPLAYSTLLPLLYLPIMIMLVALVFRGLAFEFRFKADRSQPFWDIAFATGSTIATLCQGYILGTFVTGYASNDLTITPFSMLTSIAVVMGYALLGATWLIRKTTGELQAEMFQTAKVLLVFITVFLIAVSIATPIVNPNLALRWFVMPDIFYLLPFPLLAVIAIISAAYFLHQCNEYWPFICCVSIFIFSYIGLCASIYPYLVPPRITIWQAAANPSTLKFFLTGSSILLPILIGYSIYAYHIFKGKTDTSQGYH